MRKILLILVLAVFLIPTASFAEDYQIVPSQGDTSVYYDYDSVLKSKASPHLITVTIKRELSEIEANAYTIDGVIPNAIVVTMYINTIERYFEPLDISLVKENAHKTLIDKLLADRVFNDVRMSVVEPDVEIVFFDGNGAWGIEELIAEINEKF